MTPVKRTLDPDFTDLVPAGLQGLFWDQNGKRVVNDMHTNPRHSNHLVTHVLTRIRRAWSRITA
jgi:hypothetical protein